jgi:acetoin utilization deacetylase AcuC-like enzyme
MNRATTMIWSERFRDHETAGHPESPQRLVAIREGLTRTGLWEDRTILDPASASIDDVLLVHDNRYVERVRRIAEGGGGYLDADTIVSPNTFDVALLAVGAAIQAVDLVIDGASPRVFAFPRPPGHHAERARGMGFCIFNNLAAGAAHAIDRRDLDRVAIIDWDVHHGNGTQDIFYESDQVLVVSVHQWPLYPGTGRSGEQGAGQGFGYTLNLPLPPNSGDEVYLRVFDEIIGPRIAQFLPDLLMISAGYDARRGDPLAMMNVTDDGFAAMTSRCRSWAERFCDGRMVLMLEGGYNLDGLASGVEATLRALDAPASIEENSR